MIGWLVEAYKSNAVILIFKVKAYSYFLSAGVRSGMRDVEVVIRLCLQTSAHSPEFVTVWTLRVERAQTARSLVYNQLLHTPVQLLQWQH